MEPAPLELDVGYPLTGAFGPSGNVGDVGEMSYPCCPAVVAPDVDGCRVDCRIDCLESKKGIQ
jgi:hypothetical protein